VQYISSNSIRRFSQLLGLSPDIWTIPHLFQKLLEFQVIKVFNFRFLPNFPPLMENQLELFREERFDLMDPKLKELSYQWTFHNRQASFRSFYSVSILKHLNPNLRRFCIYLTKAMLCSFAQGVWFSPSPKNFLLKDYELQRETGWHLWHLGKQ